jgi:uncharacterized protein (TIGR02118 family)
MVKFVALYRRPSDVEQFEKRYWEEHIPLVRQFPNLKQLEVSRITWPVDDSPYFLMAELWYEDRDAMKESLRSEISQQAAAVLQDLVAAGDLTMLHVEVEED